MFLVVWQAASIDQSCWIGSIGEPDRPPKEVLFDRYEAPSGLAGADAVWLIRVAAGRPGSPSSAPPGRVDGIRLRLTRPIPNGTVLHWRYGAYPMDYDAAVGPDPVDWLETDEAGRLTAVQH